MYGWIPEKERVLIVGVGGQRGDERENTYGMEASLAELAELAQSAGLEVVATLTQRMKAPALGHVRRQGEDAGASQALRAPRQLRHPTKTTSSSTRSKTGTRKDDDAAYGSNESLIDSLEYVTAEDPDDSWGEEWTDEDERALDDEEAERRKRLLAVANKSTEPTVDTVIFDTELTPRQNRNIEQFLDGKVQVCDRTMLILDIFSQRARTAEGQLQVEMAQTGVSTSPAVADVDASRTADGRRRRGWAGQGHGREADRDR
jgi:GTP-binding protein HflX